MTNLELGSELPMSWDCKVGDFRLLEQPREGVLKNPTSARVDLVVIALQ